MTEQKIIPVSVIIPTKDRAIILERTLKSLALQSSLPREIIIVDASQNDDTKNIIDKPGFPAATKFIYAKAKIKGAASQRVEAFAMSTCDFILFMDDDILLEDECISRIFGGFSVGDRVGGVNALITNQLYTKPGRPSRIMYRLMSGEQKQTYAGMVIGPVWNLLPEDDPTLPEYVECQWLNSTCTMYRRAALPDPLFSGHFHGYSMFEDVTLSVTVGRNWKLLNARTARIFHDSQTGDHKNKIVQLTEMEVVNRHYVMKEILRRNRLKDYSKLFLFELFQVTSLFRSGSSLKLLPGIIVGKFKGYFKVIFS